MSENADAVTLIDMRTKNPATTMLVLAARAAAFFSGERQPTELWQFVE